MTEPSKQLAKDVATEISRRQRRRKLLVWTLIIAIIVAAVMYLRFGRGWGLGTGTGTGSGTGSAVAPPGDAGPARCTVRVSAEGITVDGNKVSRDDAVAKCKGTEGAMVTVTGDARQGDWDELRAALQAVGVKIYIRGQLWDGKAGSGSEAPRTP